MPEHFPSSRHVRAKARNQVDVHLENSVYELPTQSSRFNPSGHFDARTKLPSGKWESQYQLEEWKPLPKDHKFLIKEFERKNKQRGDED